MPSKQAISRLRNSSFAGASGMILALLFTLASVQVCMALSSGLSTALVVTAAGLGSSLGANLVRGLLKARATRPPSPIALAVIQTGDGWVGLQPSWQD